MQYWLAKQKKRQRAKDNLREGMWSPSPMEPSNYNGRVEMQAQRKEGVIILAGGLIVLFLLAMISDWQYGFSHAEFGFSGFAVDNCRPTARQNELFCDGEKRVMAFSINFSTALMFVVPLIVYGFLRALGIIRRLFSFEARIQVLLPTEDPSDNGPRT